MTTCPHGWSIRSTRPSPSPRSYGSFRTRNMQRHTATVRKNIHGGRRSLWGNTSGNSSPGLHASSESLGNPHHNGNGGVQIRLAAVTRGIPDVGKLYRNPASCAFRCHRNRFSLIRIHARHGICVNSGVQGKGQREAQRLLLSVGHGIADGQHPSVPRITQHNLGYIV